MLEKARRMWLAAIDLGLNAHAPIYVIEHQCPKLKKILWQATSKREKCYGSSNGFVMNQSFQTKTKSTPAEKIRSAKDVSKT